MVFGVLFSINNQIKHNIYLMITIYLLKDEHGQDPETIKSNFRILRKCQSKLDCLIFEMLFIRDLKPKLNKQCDSIRAKLFV